MADEFDERAPALTTEQLEILERRRPRGRSPIQDVTNYLDEAALWEDRREMARRMGAQLGAAVDRELTTLATRALTAASLEQLREDVKAPGMTITPREVTIVMNDEDLQRLRRDPVEFAKVAWPGHDLVGSGYVLPGLAYLTRRAEEDALRERRERQLLDLEGDTYVAPQFRIAFPRGFVSLVSMADETRRAFEQLERSIREWNATIRSARAKSRRRANYEIREWVLSRRLGTTPRPWRDD